MTLLAAAAEPVHGTHVWHLLEASALVVLLLVAVSVGEHLKERRPSTPVVVIALAGAAAAAVHLGVTPGHWTQAPVYGLFFLLAGSAQLAYSALVLVRPLRGLLAVNVLGNLALLLLWAQTRTAGVPLGPAAGVRERVGPLDLASVALELVVVVVGVGLVRRGQRTVDTESTIRVQPRSAAGLPAVMHTSS